MMKAWHIFILIVEYILQSAYVHFSWTGGSIFSVLPLLVNACYFLSQKETHTQNFRLLLFYGVGSQRIWSKLNKITEWSNDTHELIWSCRMCSSSLLFIPQYFTCISWELFFLSELDNFPPMSRNGHPLAFVHRGTSAIPFKQVAMVQDKVVKGMTPS